MRLTLACLSLFLPVAALADDFVVQPRPVAATVYPVGAEVTERIELEMPAGDHRLFIPVAFRTYDIPTPRFLVSEGVQLGEISIRETFDFDPDTILTDQQTAAKDAMDAAEAALFAHDDRAAELAQTMDALNMQRGFLASLKGSGDAAPSANSLRAVGTMIAEEMAALTRRQLEVQQEMRGLKTDRPALDIAYRAASAAYRKIAPPTSGSNAYIVGLRVAEDGPVVIQFKRLAQAGWRPVYDISLSEAGASTLLVERQVDVQTAEPWFGIDLTLTTAMPFDRTEPSPAEPNIAMIYDPAPSPLMKSNSREMADSFAGAAPVPMAEPMVMEESSVFDTEMASLPDGVVVYHLSGKVTVAEDSLTLPLDVVTLPAESAIIAVPRRDETAFRMVELTNDSGQALLPGMAKLYREGVLIGDTMLGYIPEGDKVDLPFGPVQGVRLEYSLLDRQTGDKGLVKRSNEREERVLLELRNLTGEAQEVRVLYSTPVSEQEDLEISTRARPVWTEENIENKRGVVAWDVSLTPGQTQEIQLDFSLTWPEDMLLRWNP